MHSMEAEERLGLNLKQFVSERLCIPFYWTLLCARSHQTAGVQTDSLVEENETVRKMICAPFIALTM